MDTPDPQQIADFNVNEHQYAILSIRFHITFNLLEWDGVCPDDPFFLFFAYYLDTSPFSYIIFSRCLVDNK